MPVSASAASDGTKLTFVEVDVYEYIVVAMNCSQNTFHILTVKLGLHVCSLLLLFIIIIIEKEEIKVTLKTIKPLQGHFTKVNKIKLKWRCSRMKV